MAAESVFLNQLSVAAALQGRVQGTVFRRQMQLDGGTHGDDALGDFAGIVGDAGLRKAAQRRNAAQDVDVLVFEFVDVHSKGSKGKKGFGACAAWCCGVWAPMPWWFAQNGPALARR